MHNDLLARTRFQGRSLHVPAQLLFFGQWEGRSNRSETVGRTLSSAMGCDEAIEVAAPASKSHHNCLRVHIDYCDSDCESENAIVHKMSTATSLVERGSDEISPEGFFFNILAAVDGRFLLELEGRLSGFIASWPFDLLIETAPAVLV